MCRNKLSIPGGQKMSKREQQRKIATVRKQISELQLRVHKLESCLYTLQTNPDYYFQNLNNKNREYVDWKNRSVKSEKDEENKSFNKAEEEEHGATTSSTGAADNFGFFSALVGFFHSSATSVLMWGASRPSSSYGHTAPGYYSLYSHTSGGNVSFPSLGKIFSLIHDLSPSDQSSFSSSSNTVYQTNPSSNTGWNSNTNILSSSNTSNTPGSNTGWNSNSHTPSSSNTSNTPAPSTSTHQPYSGCLCADCVKKYLG